VSIPCGDDVIDAGRAVRRTRPGAFSRRVLEAVLHAEAGARERTATGAEMPPAERGDRDQRGQGQRRARHDVRGTDSQRRDPPGRLSLLAHSLLRRTRFRVASIVMRLYYPNRFLCDQYFVYVSIHNVFPYCLLCNNTQ